MRVAVGALLHETNTFTQEKTPLEYFQPVTGDAIFANPAWKGDNSTAGIIARLQSEKIEVVPTFFGSALPSGVIEFQAYEFMKKEVLEGIRRAMPIDGVCLGLHGSMYVEGIPDPEGDLLTAVRRTVGAEMPVVCALDMHATVTQAMIAAANAFTAYRTAPHVDKYETGVRAAAILVELLKRDTEFCMEWIKIPMLLAGEQSETNMPPMSALLTILADSEKQEKVSLSYMLGFPWADSPDHGISVVAVGEASHREKIKELVRKLAAAFWERRTDFTFTTEAYPLDEALSLAMRDDRKPVIIADSGDNPTAGASEDLTIVLKRVLEERYRDVLIAVIVDPKAYKTCEQAGEGSCISLELGRIGPEPAAAPLAFNACIKRIKPVRGIHCAVIDANGVTVIITDTRTDVYDPAFLEELNLHYAAYKLIVVKSGYLSPEYQQIAARKMLALTPGDTAEIFTDLAYIKLQRPIYPLDPEMQWHI